MERQDRRKICRYYAKGRCVKQDCPFIHQQQTKKTCKFYTETGYCRKGKNCEFYHAIQQDLKKDKKFIEKNVEQKLLVKELGNKNQLTKEKEQIKNSNINKIFEQQSQITQPQINRHKDIQFIDSLLSNLPKFEDANESIQQQDLIRQLTQQLNKIEENQDQYKKVQFKMLYPHSFPDYNKTLQKKQYIKFVETKYFSEKPFIQLINSFDQKKQHHKIQYFQIIRRYQDSFCLENEDQPNIFIVKLRPILYNKQMNLLFKIEQPEQKIMIKVNQIQYPEIRAKFQILNESIPKAYKIKFSQFLNKLHLKYTVFETLKYLQNNFETTYNKIRQKIQNQHYLRLQLNKRISEETKILESRKHIEKENKKNQEKIRQIIKNEDNQVNKQQKQQIKDVTQENNPIKIEKKEQTKKQGQKIIKQYRDYFQLQFSAYDKPEHQNLNDQITVESILMQNCPYLVIEKILLYIQCACSKNIMYLFDAFQKKELKLWIKLKCKKCNDCMRIVWQRQVIQYKATLVSKMSIINGKIIDIGGIGWKIGCQCDEQIIKNKLYLPGERLQINCHSCFQNMNIIYNGIKFFNPFVKQFQMQQQKQLPMKGACNHDKLNFKWSRYACCGRPFACDECHELGSIKKHQILAGITMICGYCSYQQNISSQCTRCKKQLLKGIDKAGHWQGGLGCRDKNLLSRKDAKKYSGATKQFKQKEKK